VTAAALSLLDPLGYEFFQRGLVVAGVSGALCGLVGVYVVVRSMAYIGHGLSHAVFGGAAISAVMGVSYFLGAGLWGVLAALTIGRVAGRGVIGADAAIGVVTTASFAVGLAIQSRNSSVSRSLDTVLFGNVFGRELEFVSFDRDVARVSGVAVERIDALLMLVLSVTVLVSVRVIGALLISAMLVLPAATARSLTSSIHRMLWMSPLLGATVGVVGMYLSWYLDIPSGAVITLVGTAAFATAWLTADLGRRRAAAVDDHAVVS
jgi:ABC-type Mn2+/Zn2+ transport system permease subunit